jgi:molybdopterin-guanine dinucleotide biosynthesis protein A
MRRRRDPVGVVLAGGLGRRIGGSKAIVELCGRPLIAYPLAALTDCLSDVAIIAKPDTELPNFPGVTLWIEPATPRHPLVGIVQALGLAAGRPVLACAGDLPFVTPGLIDRIADTDPCGAPAVVPVCEGVLQPLLAMYMPAAAALLAPAAERGQTPLRREVEALQPRILEVIDPEPFFNVNAPEDLLQAAALLDGRISRR